MASSADPLSAHVRTPEDIALRADVDDVAPLLPPDPTRLFAERALRLRQLAAGHAMRDYLMLLALICEAQHARAQQRIALALRADRLAACAAFLKPSLTGSFYLLAAFGLGLGDGESLVLASGGYRVRQRLFRLALY